MNQFEFDNIVDSVHWTHAGRMTDILGCKVYTKTKYSQQKEI